MDVSDIFYFYFLVGEGKGGVRGASKGGQFFVENPRKGGVCRRRRGRKAGRVSAANWGIWGGGTKYKVFPWIRHP